MTHGHRATIRDDLKESLAEATRISTIAEGLAVLLFLAALTVWLALGSGA